MYRVCGSRTPLAPPRIFPPPLIGATPKQRGRQLWVWVGVCDHHIRVPSDPNPPPPVSFGIALLECHGAVGVLSLVVGTMLPPRTHPGTLLLCDVLCPWSTIRTFEGHFHGCILLPPLLVPCKQCSASQKTPYTNFIWHNRHPLVSQLFCPPYLPYPCPSWMVAHCVPMTLDHTSKTLFYRNYHGSLVHVKNTALCTPNLWREENSCAGGGGGGA